jgi:hypothetical protein
VLVIDVLESASHPASRWLYATRAAYLALDPASLAFLTATILTPPIKRERVRFVDNDCRYSGQVPSQPPTHTSATPHHPWSLG